MPELIGLVTALAGLAGGGALAYRARADRKATVAVTDQTVVATATEMAERLVKTAAALVQPLEQRVAETTTALGEVQARLDLSESRHAECEERAAGLEAAVNRLESAQGGRRAQD